jgi:hypothetical protein
MPESRWVMVRVDRTTHARLEKARASMLAAHEQGKIALELDSRDRLSLDQVIVYLLGHKKRHAKRRAKAAAKKAAAKNRS